LIDDSSAFIIENELKTSLTNINAIVEKIEWGKRGKTNIVLRGYLPLAYYLIVMADGIALEIQNEPCSRKDIYVDGTTIIRIADCEIIKRWIEQPVSIQPSHNDIEIFVELEGASIEFPQEQIKMGSE